MGATFITPVDVSPSESGAWEDIDVSGSAPVGTTGVILRIKHSGTVDFRIRKNGSTDDVADFAYSNSLGWLAIGVDGDRIFEAKGSGPDYISIYLVGYFDNEASFFTNAIDVTTTNPSIWEDVDISGDTGGNTAIGVFLNVHADAGIDWGVRKNGSADARLYDTDDFGAATIGVDGSEVYEMYSDGAIAYLQGYIMVGATFNTNGTDISLGSTGSWTDLTALPAGGIGGIIEIVQSAWEYTYGLRENGSAETLTGICWGEPHAFGLVEADGSRLIEGIISNTGTDFFLVGYFTSGAEQSPVPIILQQAS